MAYRVSEEGNVSTVFLNGEIDMDVTDKAKAVIFPIIENTHTFVYCIEALQQWPRFNFCSVLPLRT